MLARSAFLGLLALGDVARDHRSAHDLAGAVADRRNRQRDRNTLPVLADPLGFQPLDILAAAELGHRSWPIRRRDLRGRSA